MGPQILWLKFSHYASKNIKPKELIFPKVTLKREARHTKIQILSFPTHWFSLTWPLIQPLTSLSDPSLTLTLLGPFNLVNHFPCFSTQNRVLWEGKTVKENHLWQCSLNLLEHKKRLIAFVKYTPRPFARDFDSINLGWALESTF